MEAVDQRYMKRCFELARIAQTHVGTNPMVGAVIVYQKKIIGEGYHEQYGANHAEINAINSVAKEARKWLSKSTFYISLEPCFHFGKTAPCVDQLIALQIPEVIISCLDPHQKVAGKSIKKLKAQGVKVKFGILEEEGRALIAPFFNYHFLKRPYILLKYAQTRDGFMGQSDKQIWFTNSFSKRLVHKWRTEVAAILVGTNTANLDNPQLTSRYFSGNQALRIVLDRQLRLASNLNLFDDQYPSWIITEQAIPKNKFNQTQYFQLDFKNLIPALLQLLHQHKITSLLVEGGAQLLSSFLKEGQWDEARVFTSPQILKEGIEAPKIEQVPNKIVKLAEDQLNFYYNKQALEARNQYFQQI